MSPRLPVLLVSAALAASCCSFTASAAALQPLEHELEHADAALHAASHVGRHNATTAAAPPEDLAALLARIANATHAVEELLSAVCSAELIEFARDLQAVHPSRLESATNLVHYIGLRRHDIRPLQADLHVLGVSSLGSSESHVLPSLLALRAMLGAAVLGFRNNHSASGTAELDEFDAPAGWNCASTHRQLLPGAHGAKPPVSATSPFPPRALFESGPAHLRHHADSLLGPSPPHHATRVMVTIPTEAATDPSVVASLIAGGMSIARINCAHDGPAAWAAMVANIRRADAAVAAAAVAAAGESGSLQHAHPSPTIISFDLAGPKLRTGSIPAGPSVVAWHPKRDVLGRVVEAARVVFFLEAASTDAAAPHKGELWTDSVPVPLEHSPQGVAFLAAATPSDVLIVDVDARDKGLDLTVIAVAPDHSAVLAVATKSAYLTPGTELRLPHPHVTVATGESRLTARVGAIAPKPAFLWLKVDDVVRFVLGDEPCRAATPEDPHTVLFVNVPEVFRDVRVGQRVFLDDGKFGALVTAVREGEITARITLAPGGLGKLGAEKGINLPDTHLELPALGADDRADLAAVLPLRPDFFSLSFTQKPSDVFDLHEALNAAGDAGKGVGVVLKIETASGFAHLPALILAALRRPRAGLMIARGDLGVEVGFARLSEVQEEILWVAEAAHVPSIWATQVLDSLARTGVPTRGDVTDAAMAARAEAVMLNKGPFMTNVLAFVDDVFTRASAHHSKQMHTLRGLRVAARQEVEVVASPAAPGIGKHAHAT